MLATINEQDLQVVTFSAFRAHSFACGVEEPNWDFLGLEEQMSWERLCRRIEAILLEKEGSSYPEAAKRVYEAFYLGAPVMGWEVLPAKMRLAWEAVTRHLMNLIDGEEISDLDGLERSWRDWVLLRSGTHP